MTFVAVATKSLETEHSEKNSYSQGKGLYSDHKNYLV